MSGLRERNRLRTRGDITAAALTLFEQRGYDDTTVEQIATSAGLSSATFFRYFSSKEDVLFADEDDVATTMTRMAAARPDRTMSVAALAAPVTEFAAAIVDAGESHRLTRLVMTTRALEPRSLRMRLRWERDLAQQLAAERGLAGPALEHTLVAAIAVSCLTSALRHWDDRAGAEIDALVAAAFRFIASAPDALTAP